MRANNEWQSDKHNLQKRINFACFLIKQFGISIASIKLSFRFLPPVLIQFFGLPEIRLETAMGGLAMGNFA
jgi:hypothetical protein